MKSMSWVLYEDDYIPHECLSCGFITRSPSIYRRHSRHCADLSAKTGPSSLAAIHTNSTDQLNSFDNREAMLCGVLASILPAKTDSKNGCDVTVPCDNTISEEFAVCQKACMLPEVSSAPVDLQSVCDAVKHEDNTITTFLAAAKNVTPHEINDQSCHSVLTVPVVELPAKNTMKIELVKNSDEKFSSASSQALNDQNCRSSSENEDRDNKQDSNDYDVLECSNQLSGDSTDSTSRKLGAKKKSVGGKIYNCSRCSFSSTSKSERRAHMRTVHSVMRRVHQCKDCSYQSVEHKNLLRHMERHLLTGPFKCNLCTYSSTSQSAVRKHMVFNHCDSTCEQQSAIGDSFFDSNKISLLNDESGSKDTLCTPPKKDSVSHCKSINKKSFSDSQSKITAEISNLVDNTPSSAESELKLVSTGDKSSDVCDMSSQACDMIIEVKHIAESADNINELWTCLSCGMSYEDRAKVRRHVKTKHHISMSMCHLVDNRITTSDSCCNDNSPIKCTQSAISSEVLHVSADLPSNEHVAEKLLKPHKMRKHLSKKQISTLGSTVEDISIVKMDITQDDSSATVSKKKSQSTCPSPVRKRTMNDRRSSPKPKITSGTSITTEEKSDKLSSEIDLRLQQSNLLTTDSVPSPKKIKKLVLLNQNAISLEVSENQKKKFCTSVKSQSKLVSSSPSNQVSSVSKVLFQLNKRNKIPKLLSFHAQQSVVGTSKITKHINSDQIQSTPDTPQRSQRPHFSELVKSIKSDDSSSPVKVQKLALFTASPLVSELKSYTGSAELKTEIPVPVHKRVGKTKSLHRKKEVVVSNKLGTKVEDGLGESQLDPDKESHEDLINLDDDSSKLSNSSELHPDKDDAADSAPSQQLRCAHCSYCSNRLSVLRRHLLSHISEKRYACDRCSRQYKHEWSLTLHQRHAHKKASNRSSKEPLLTKDIKVSKTACKSGRSVQKIDKHRKKDHVLENLPKVKKIRNITNCKPNDEQLDDNNLEKSDSTIDQESLTEREPLIKDMKQTKKLIEGSNLNPHDSVASLKCRYCDFVGELASHMKIHMGNRKYRCPLETCVYKSNWACDMKKHIKKYHSDYLQANGNLSLRDVIRKALDHVSDEASGVRHRKTKEGKIPGITTTSEVDQDSGSNSSNSVDTLFHRKKLLPTDKDENDKSRMDAASDLQMNAHGMNYRKIPAAERYRPFKCSACGKRSNWRWDIMKHLRLMHLDNLDAHIVVLNAEVAKKTLIKMFRRPKSNKFRNTSRSTMESVVDLTDETGVADSVNDSRTLDNVIDSVAHGKDLDSRSIGVVDVLRLKRFRCSGCPYRSNHRTDIGRHIRFVHGRGNCKVEVLSTLVASTTLQAYKLSTRRRSTRDLHGDLIGDVDHKPRDDIKRGTPNIFTPSEFLKHESDTTDNYAKVDEKEIATKAAKDPPLFDLVPTKVEDNSWKRRFRDTAIMEYEDMAKCCDICPFRTDRTGLLALHKLRHRAPSTKASKTTQLLYTCPHCPYFVHTSRQLEKHVVLHDGINTTRLDPIVTTTLPVVGNERYVCENCPFITVYRNDFWIHRRMHLGPGPNGTIPKCNLCMFWTTDKRMMLEHIGLHTLCYYPSLVHQSNVSCEGTGLGLPPVNQVDAAQINESVQQLVQHEDEVEPIAESKFNSTSNESRSGFKVLTALCCDEHDENSSVDAVDECSGKLIDKLTVENVQNNTLVTEECVNHLTPVTEECVDQPTPVTEDCVDQPTPVTAECVDQPTPVTPVIEDCVDQPTPMTAECVDQPTPVTEDCVDQPTPVTAECVDQPTPVTPVIEDCVDQPTPMTAECVDQPTPVTAECVDQPTPVIEDCVDQPKLETVLESCGSSMMCRNVEIMVDQQNNQIGELPAESKLRGSAVIPSCRCALQCPYCYFSIASVRLLRQHIVFHISLCDANKTPLFDSRLDNVEDGVVADDMCGSVKQCSHCWLRSQLLFSDCNGQLLSVHAASMAADNVNFFSQMGLCAQINKSSVDEN